MQIPAGERGDAVETFLRDLQDGLCGALEAIDGARFREDVWQRAEGGGGRTRVLTDGALFEQGGVNFSRVHGERLPPAATAQRPDLLITDYHMPELSGLELCQRLQQDPEMRSIPKIMLTARGYNLEQADTDSSGIRCLLSKPFSPRQLLAMVNEVLQHGIAA